MPTFQKSVIGAWTTATALPEPICAAQVIATATHAYLLGGITFDGQTSKVYKAPINVDGSLGNWTAGDSLPEAIAESQAIVTSNRVYLIGGYAGLNYSNNVYTAAINANGTLGSWSLASILPCPVSDSHTVLTSSRVYLLGGFTGQECSSQVYTAVLNADGTLGDWVITNPLPMTILGAQVVCTSSQVYLLGGYVNGAPSATVYKAPLNAQGELGEWRAVGTMPEDSLYAQAVLTCDHVYLLGGCMAGVKATSKVHKAPLNTDGTLGAWTTVNSLPSPVGDSQVFVTPNQVYLLGGHDSETVSKTVYTAPLIDRETLEA